MFGFPYLIYIAENWDKSDKKVYPTGDHQPPEDIGANFYPSLGPYSSRYCRVQGFIFSNIKLKKLK